MPPIVDVNYCNGCKQCYNMCPLDIYAWDSKKKVPIVAYPDECSHCGICELDCLQLAIDVQLPVYTRM